MEGDEFIHPVVRSIMLHFQLAFDHPFAEGNGRCARALFYWSMLRRGYWMAEFISISRLLYQHRAPYLMSYQYTESDEHDAAYFVLHQLSVLERSISELFQYVARKGLELERTRSLIKRRRDLNVRQIALLGHALRKPETRYTHESHGNSHRVSIVTARKDLMQLVHMKFIKA